MKVFQAIANEIYRINMGQVHAIDSLRDLVHDFLPTGSGFDGEIEVEYDEDKRLCDKYTLVVPYHCMNDDGYYDGWIEIKYTITPSFSDYNMKENWQGYKGKYKETLKDYIGDTIAYALDQPVIHKWDSTKQRNYYSN
jgi:hypothetical protein